MDDYYPHVRQNWFQRNWKWFVPTGCLSLIVIVVLFGIALFKGVTSMMKNSDVYVHAMEVVHKNKAVNEKIGMPIEENGMSSGSISTSNSSGSAFMEIPVKGPKGEGMIHVEAERINNVWTYEVIDFYPKGSTTPINLLEEKPAE